MQLVEELTTGFVVSAMLNFLGEPNHRTSLFLVGLLVFDFFGGKSVLSRLLFSTLPFTSRESPMSKTPVKVIRMGFIKSAIWCNKTKFGVRHAVTVSRIFKNGDTWQESTRFGRDDLLLVAKVLELSHQWIYFQSKEEGEGSDEGNTDEQ